MRDGIAKNAVHIHNQIIQEINFILVLDDENSMGIIHDYTLIKEFELENHAIYFRSGVMLKTNMCKNIFSTNEEIIAELYKLILSTKVGKELEEELKHFADKELIRLGDFKEFGGRLVYKQNNVFDAKIQLDVNRSINMLAAVLVHELTHYKDFKSMTHSTKPTSITIFSTEAHAFHATYQFLLEIDYLESDEYRGYPPVIRQLLTYSPRFLQNQYDMQNIQYMSFLLAKIGYPVKNQKIPLYAKTRRDAINHTKAASTQDIFKLRSQRVS